MDYGARFYSSTLGRFISPDTIIPVASQGNGAFDRYAYVNNNPVRYTDPTGHYEDDGDGPRRSRRSGKGSYTSQINSMIEPEKMVLGGATWQNWGQYRGPDEYHCNHGDIWHMSVDGFAANPTLRPRPEVYAALDGLVVYSAYLGPGFGNVVIVETDIDGKKFYSVYAHLGSDEKDVNTRELKNTGRNVKAGIKVSKGDLIGYMGNSGSQDDIHLHFEVRTANNLNSKWKSPEGGPRYWAFSTTWKQDFVDISGAFHLSADTTVIPAPATSSYCAATPSWVWGDSESKYR
ncbi:MAG TPA: peptidoglycan DD-metalloendopeptidase family protein [Anaerolineaceae bacterium]|mgnify:CR=1 FL=1|nr:peptidoglycan DD-metalloendopeptidase family protein [Anaerolineaceae bacterium]